MSARMTSIPIVSLLAAVCATGGCQRNQQVAELEPVSNDLDSQVETPADPPVNAPLAIDANAVRELTIEDIASRFERDAEMIRQMKIGREAEPVEASPPPDDPPPAEETTVIRWNDGDTTRTPSDAVAAGLDAASNQPQDVETDAANAEDTTTSPSPESAGDETFAPVPAEVRQRELMVSLSSVLYREASYADTPLPHYLLIAAMSMIDPDRTINSEAVHALTDRERDILAAYQDFFQELGSQLASTGDSEVLVEAIEDLRESVRGEPTLTVARGLLCWRVTGYGQYDEFDRNSFIAGTGQQVILYTELEGFTSVLNEQDEWVTDLTEEVVIYNTKDGIPVSRQPEMSVPDRSRNQRREFYITHLITLPETLSVGAYTMKVRVTDEATGAVAETGIEFTVVADATLAAKVPQ